MIAPHQKLRIIVGGMVGQFPLGGVAWDYFHYVLGLHELGHEVYYYEDTWVWPFDPVRRYPTDDPGYTVRFLGEFFERWAPELKDRWHYLLLHEKAFGMSKEAFAQVARTADVFLNVSGACFFPEDLNPKCIKVFMDTDPGYNQIMLSEKLAWSENVERWCQQVASHDRHLTYAENIYGEDCVLPRLHFDWQPTRCIVTLGEWAKVKASKPAPGAPFTTVMSWSYWKGDLAYKGIIYGTKVPEYDRFHDLPRHADVPLALAIGGHKTPVKEIKEDGWQLIDAQDATLTAESYQQFIANSAGEWSIAKNVFVATRSGWFSCRTACYLAAARPAVVQETAWSKFIPAGRGVLAFSTMHEAVAGLKEVAGNWLAHSAAAYDIAREYLAPDRVLPTMMQAIFAAKRVKPQTPGVIPPSINLAATAKG